MLQDLEKPSPGVADGGIATVDISAISGQKTHTTVSCCASQRPGSSDYSIVPRIRLRYAAHWLVRFGSFVQYLHTGLV